MEFIWDYFWSLTRPWGRGCTGAGNPPLLQCNYSELISSTLLSALLGQELHAGTLLFPIPSRPALSSLSVGVCVCDFVSRRACPCMSVLRGDLRVCVWLESEQPLWILCLRQPRIFLLRTAAAVKRRLRLDVPAEPQSGATGCQRLIRGPVRLSAEASLHRSSA